MHQSYGRTPMQKSYFNKVTRQLYWNHTLAWDSPVNMLHIFRTHFPYKTSGELILDLEPFQTFMMQLFYKNSSSDSKQRSIFTNKTVIDICQIPKNTSDFPDLLCKIFFKLYSWTLYFPMSQNGQAHLKNLAAFAAWLLKCIWPFYDIAK